MANGPGSGSMLPPDIRQQMQQRNKSTSGGIGGGARENAAIARQRELAVNPDAAHEREEDQETEAQSAEAAPEDLKVCPNPRCLIELKAEWNFCSKCGADLIRGGAAERIGITFTEQDITDYLFKGHVVKEIALLGKHSMTVKSAQPTDAGEIDNYLMNGKWSKNADGSEKKISDYYLRQINSLCITAASVVKFDGTSIGDTLSARVAYLQDRGSALVDLISNRVALFNQALTEYLKREDTLLGS